MVPPAVFETLLNTRHWPIIFGKPEVELGKRPYLKVSVVGGGSRPIWKLTG
jgi:hypothetical protein